MRSPAVDNYLFGLPEPQRQTMEAIREMILQLVPTVEEHVKWNCPFYSSNGLLCYINFDRKAKQVALCFVEGFQLEDTYGLLDKDKKQIAKLYIAEDQNFNKRVIHYYLRQAVAINKGKHKNFLNIRKGKL
jgi:hypothetical protein